MNPIMDEIRKHARAQVKEVIMGSLAGIGDVVVDLAYSVALVGGGLSIILHVAGWGKGKRWTGILVVGYTLIKYLLG